MRTPVERGALFDDDCASRFTGFSAIGVARSRSCAARVLISPKTSVSATWRPTADLMLAANWLRVFVAVNGRQEAHVAAGTAAQQSYFLGLDRIDLLT